MTTAGSGEFKIDFAAADSLMSDGHKSASQIGDYFDGQVNQALNLNHFDSAHEQLGQTYQVSQKATGYWTDGVHAAADAHGEVGEIGRQTLDQAKRIIST